MRKLIWLRSTLILAGLALAAALNPRVEALSLGLEPLTQSTSIGGSVNVALNIAGLGDTELAAFDVWINYNPLVVSLTSVTFGTSLGDSFPGMDHNAVSGSLELFAASITDEAVLDALQDGDFTLAVLQFSGLNAGVSPLDLIDAILGDGNGDPLTAALSGASIQVTGAQGVPEGGMLAPGVFLLAFTILACRLKLNRW